MKTIAHLGLSALMSPMPWATGSCRRASRIADLDANLAATDYANAARVAPQRTSPASALLLLAVVRQPRPWRSRLHATI